MGSDENPCNTCVDYIHRCVVDVSSQAYASCESYNGACPCENISMNCSGCSRLNESSSEKRETLTDRLNPTNDMRALDNHVHEVKGDGSISCGGEVTTIGRKINWDKLLKVNRKIAKEIISLGGDTNSLTGGHIHYLLGYTRSNGGYNNSWATEQDISIPVSIVSNIYSICIYFMDAITWITSTGNTPEEFTRPMVYRKLPKKAPTEEDVLNIKNYIQANIRQGDRYGFINPLCQWNTSSKIGTFHLEFRTPDALLSGTGVTALQILYSAIVRKAVKVSKDGLIYFNKNKSDKALKFAGRMMSKNNLYPSQHEHKVVPLTDKEKAFLKNKTHALIEWLKPEIMYYGLEPYLALNSLAKEPCSIMRSAGKEWDSIDTKLFRIANKPNNKVVKRMHFSIEQAKITANNPVEWIIVFAEKNGFAVEDVQTQIINRKDVVWDTDYGTFVIA
jgi:hypothetical protein